MLGPRFNYAPALVVIGEGDDLLSLLVDALRTKGYQAHSEAARLSEEPPELFAGPTLLLVDGHRCPLGRIPEQLVREDGFRYTFLKPAESVADSELPLPVYPLARNQSYAPAFAEEPLRKGKYVPIEGDVPFGSRHERDIIQTALDGFARFNSKGAFIEVNEAMCDLLGYSSGELLRMRASDVDTVRAPAELLEQIRTLEHNQRVRFATRLRCAGGGTVEVKISLWRDSTEIFAFIHDISDERRLEREVLEMGEEERRRIGRELHDGLGQQLTALEFLCHSLGQRLKSQAPALEGAVQEISRNIRQTVAHARRLSHGLTPVSLESEGLMDALRDLANVTASSGVPCEFSCSSRVVITDTSTASHLFRIAQEAVGNAVKHSPAQSILIALEEHHDRVELTVTQRGRGLLPSKASQDVVLGMHVIHYRARLIGARLEVRSEATESVHIVCSLPK